jgi:hypothetical protein
MQLLEYNVYGFINKIEVEDPFKIKGGYLDFIS